MSVQEKPHPHRKNGAATRPNSGTTITTSVTTRIKKARATKRCRGQFVRWIGDREDRFFTHGKLPAGGLSCGRDGSRRTIAV